MLVAATFLAWIDTTCALDQPKPTAEARAASFLAVEVPKWSAEHRCYSCHNNGDAARALFAAKKAGLIVPPAATEDTTEWLANPDRWSKNGGEGPFNDRRLARIQFTAALASAVTTGVVADRRALATAADSLAADQSEDGSWSIDDGDGSIGSPATYGRPLATVLARRALIEDDPKNHRVAIERATRWLGDLRVVSTLDAAAVAWAFGKDSTPRADGRRREAAGRLKATQNQDGGWGPFADSAPEVFDTALAVLALAGPGGEGVDEGLGEAVRRGRSYLIARQDEDGGWPETTRPSGGESYAQRISTTAWATLALLASGGDPEKVGGSRPGISLIRSTIPVDRCCATDAARHSPNHPSRSCQGPGRTAE